MFVRVLEIPPSGEGYRFSGGERQEFVEVDWFRDDDPEATHGHQHGTSDWRTAMVDFIRRKRYYKPGQAYLVLCTGLPHSTFCINYDEEKAHVRDTGG